MATVPEFLEAYPSEQSATTSTSTSNPQQPSSAADLPRKVIRGWTLSLSLSFTHPDREASECE
jgi:hypothetical protein